MPAGPTTQVSDIITPEAWQLIGPYIEQRTIELTRVVQSGMVTVDPQLNSFLMGGGLMGNYTSWQAITRSGDDSNVSADTAADILAAPAAAGMDFPRNDATPLKVETSRETYVRLSRNQSWGSSDLSASLAGQDPLMVVANQIVQYRANELQKAVISVWRGVVADNTANDAGDYSHSVAGSSYTAGSTDFSASAMINAMQTLGDHKEMLSIVCVHSVVHARMQQNDLIDFIPDSKADIGFGMFLGKTLVVDDSMPQTGGVYDTWLFGPGATSLGMGDAKVPIEFYRYPLAGSGGGMETMTNRWEWVIHPRGHTWSAASTPDGGPSNSTMQGATSWDRAYPNRKQIAFARLVTRES